MFQWKAEYAVGDTLIDTEHQKLFGIAQRLHDQAQKAGVNETEMREILKELFDYMRMHFAHEEELQMRIGYPQAQAHSQLHLHIIHQVEEYLRESTSLAQLQSRLERFLRIWILDHVLQHDRKMIPYF